MKKLIFWIIMIMLLAGSAEAANGHVRQDIRPLELVKAAAITHNFFPEPCVCISW